MTEIAAKKTLRMDFFSVGGLGRLRGAGGQPQRALGTDSEYDRTKEVIKGDHNAAHLMIMAAGFSTHLRLEVIF